MNHSFARVFTLTSIPNALAERQSVLRARVAALRPIPCHSSMGKASG